jgi:hypothetical protein
MDLFIWINTLVILFTIVLTVALLFAGLREVRQFREEAAKTQAETAKAFAAMAKSLEAITKSLEVITQSLARVEQISLNTLSRLAQGPQV